MKDYNADSIKTLEFGRAICEKLGMYLSADKEEALSLGLRELIYNSQDEYEQGYGNKIEVEILTKERKIVVKDNARGIPIGVRKDGTNSLTASLLLPHSGAKHKDGAYVGAVGINGMGAKIVCHTSSFFSATVYRDGQIYNQKFKGDDDGAKPLTDVKVMGKTSKTGTIIEYIPNKTIYGEAWFDYNELKKSLKELSYFTKGLMFKINIDGKKESFHSKNGLADGLSAQGRIGKNILYYSDEYDEVKVELAIQWNSKERKLSSYANNLKVQNGGPFMTGFKSSLTKTFNSLANKNFSGAIIRRYLDGFVSVKVKEVKFSNQSKTALANTEARTATSKITSEALKSFYETHFNDFEKIVEVLEKEERAEKTAEKVRQAVLNTDKLTDKVKGKKAVLAGKLTDCATHGPNSILFVTEGNSAAGSIINARDAKTMAVLPLRGKIISALKHNVDEVLENAQIQDLITALGCGVFDKCDPKKLRYGKIGIFVDADVDGYSIMCLLLTFFYKFMPQLIEEGKIFWVKSPLYTITDKQENRRYAYDEKELQLLLKEKSGTIKRNKGIGELSPKDIRETILDPKITKITKLITGDTALMNSLFELLMGEDVEPRKKYIFKHLDFSTVVD